jgi:hypothetical protein
MDVATLSMMITPDMFQNVNDMLQLAIACCDRPPKAIAADIGYSVDSIYSALKGSRSIPVKARQKLSQVNFIAAAAVAMEATGFKRLFGYQKVDRHVQSMIIRLKRQDKEISGVLNELPEMLLDKNSYEDLTADEVNQITMIACRLVDRANGTINLVMELETRYKLGLTGYLQGKEKAACVGAQTTFTGKTNSIN